MAKNGYYLDLAPGLEDNLAKIKKRDPALIHQLDRQVAKILREPSLGKPLRNVLKNCRRVQVSSFVLVYEVISQTVRLLDFDHHDRIYKRFWRC